MFPMVLPVPRTSISFGTGCPACFLRQTGSASMAIGLSTGAFPSNVMVPVTVEAARATPGQNMTTSRAASHNLIHVPRMLDSVVIANLRTKLGIARTVHEIRRAGQQTSDILERERLGKPWVAHGYERLPSHQPAR